MAYANSSNAQIVVDILKQFNEQYVDGQETLELSFNRIDSFINDARHKALKLINTSKASTSTRKNKRRTELDEDNKENKKYKSNKEESDAESKQNARRNAVKSQEVKREIIIEEDEEAPEGKGSRESTIRRAPKQETENSDKETENKALKNGEDEAVSSSTASKTRQRGKCGSRTKTPKPEPENAKNETQGRLRIVQAVKNSEDEAVSLASGPRTRRFTRLQAKLQDDNSTSQPKSATNPEKIRKTEVLKKVKAYEEKYISPTKVSPLKINDGASSSRCYVSVLSPVKLQDKKLLMKPLVVCSPVDYKRIVTTKETSDLECSEKTQEPVEKSRRSTIKKQSSVGQNYILKTHTRRSCRRSNRPSSVQRGKLVADSAKNSVFDFDETDSGSNKLRLSSTSSDGASEDEEEIPRTPTPPRNKKTQQILAKVRSAKGSGLYEQKSSSLEASCSKKRPGSRIFSTPSSASKLSGRFVSPKILEAKLIRERQEKLSQKEEKSKQTQRWRKERLKMQVEETKRNRALRLQKVMEKRRQQEEQRQQQALVRSASKERPRMTPSKSCDKLREKINQAEKRRTKEEELRQMRLQEKEEDRLRVLEQAQKKKEMELLKQQERVAEQRRLQLEREAMREQEEKRRVELIKQRMMEEEAKKKKEMEIQRLKDLQRQAAEIERQRIEREKAELKRIIVANEAKKEKMLNTTFETTTTLNTTYTGPKIANPDCYDMTPEVVKPIPLIDPNNYDIADLNSEDSTDDESNPRKYIPLWAQSRNIKIAARLQIKPDFDLNELFPSFDPPDLVEIFRKTRSRFFKRTSSANWSSPVRSHNLSGYYSS